MKRFAALIAALLAMPGAIVALALIAMPAAAQGCGPQNPNCIVPTVQPCASDNRAASTGYITFCASSGAITVGTTPILNGVNGGLLYDAAGILQNNGPIISACAAPTGNGQWMICSTVANGVNVFGQGSTNDLQLQNKNQAAVLSIATGTTSITLNAITGSTQCLHASTTGVVTGTGSDCSAGGGTPGGSSLQFQYNNAAAFGGANVWRTGANQTDFSNSANAQAIRVYNSTDNNGGAPTNASWLDINYTTTAGSATIATNLSGSGAATNLALVSNATVGLQGTTVQITSTGNSIQFRANGLEPYAMDSNFIYVNSTGGAGAFDTTLTRVTNNVLGIGNGSGGGANPISGWIEWVGENRLDADFSVTSNTTLANVTGTSHSLTVSLQAGRKYIFSIPLFFTTGASAGGIKVGLGGTATITNLIADGICNDGPTVVAINVTQISTLTQMVANTNAGTTPKCLISGTFEVNAAGTLTVQFAQNASSVTASVVKRGSYLFINDAF